MGAFTRIPADTFEQIQTEAGMLLYNFDPENPNSYKEEDIICPTTGGVTIRCVPTTSDMGEDVDNCPANIQYQYLKPKDVLQRAIMGAKHPLVVS